jgi:FlaA1/EpsC-like NDP-sugar epimerase
VMAVRELMNDAGRDVRILGFIDDDGRKRRNRVRGYPVLGSFDRLSQMIEAGRVDGVVLSIRSIDAARLRTLEALCLAHAVPLSRLTIGLSPVAVADQGLTGIAAARPRG